MLERILFIPDCHFPYNNKQAWKLLLKVATTFKPSIIVILGDFFDFYAVSSYSKNPTRASLLDREITSGIEALEELNALGAKRKIFIAGNHEYRLERYIIDKAPALFKTVKLTEILRLDKLGFEYVPYREFIQIGKLLITHDLDRVSHRAHEQAMEDVQGNVVIGHTHRFSYTIKGSVKGESHVGAMFGWLGDVDQIDYRNKARARRDCVLGCGIGFLDTKTDYIYLTPIPFINYTACLNGQLIELKLKS